MKEAEFRALLAIEGLELQVEATYFRTGGFDTRSGKRHSQAKVIGKDGYPVMSTNWVQRRHYAIQSLIKRYYGD